MLHVVDREDGKLVFKLPVTTLLNHDVPLTPEGVRVCPVAGVQWNGPAFSPQTGFLYVNAIDWCTLFKLGPDPKWVATVPYTGTRQRLGHERSDLDKWTGWINAVDPKTGKDGVAHEMADADVRGRDADRRRRAVHGDLDGNFLALDARSGKSSIASTPADRSPAAS